MADTEKPELVLVKVLFSVKVICSFTTQSQALANIATKAFKNIVEKGENAGLCGKELKIYNRKNNICLKIVFQCVPLISHKKMRTFANFQFFYPFVTHFSVTVGKNYALTITQA